MDDKDGNTNLAERQVEEIEHAEAHAIPCADKKSEVLVNKTPAAAASEVNAREHPELVEPPRQLLINADGLKNALHGLGNMALAHEIAVNKDFQLQKIFQKPEYDEGLPEDIEKKIDEKGPAYRAKVEAHNAFWKRLDDVLTGREVRDSKIILQNVIEMLKEGLLSTLLPHNTTTREKIHREMDMSHIAKQIERDAFDIDYYMDFILTTLGTVCCPVRDKDISDARKMTNTTNKVRKTTDIIENMNMDMANFIIGQCRSTIIQHCITYERDKFASYVEMQYHIGNDPLKVTRNWILRHTIPDRKFNETMALSFADIIFGNWDGKEWPETLALDWLRFPKILDEIRRVTILAAMIASTFEYGKSIMVEEVGPTEYERKQQIAVRNSKLLVKFREQLNIMLTDDDMENPEKFEKAIERCSYHTAMIIDHHRKSELGVGITEEQVEKIKSLVTPLRDLQHPVRLLFEKRVRDWLIELVTIGAEHPVPFAANLGVAGPLILSPIQDMLKLVTYNRGVFDTVYKEIQEGRFPPPKFIEDPTTDKMDDYVVDLLAKLNGYTDRNLVFTRSKMYQPNLAGKSDMLEPFSQNRRDKQLLIDEPTINTIPELGHTMPDLLKILERDDIIAANKLNSIKHRLDKEAIEKRVTQNLPVFLKEWSEGWGALQQEYCRLQRDIDKGGATPLPRGAADYPGEQRKIEPNNGQKTPPSAASEPDLETAKAQNTPNEEIIDLEQPPTRSTV